MKPLHFLITALALFTISTAGNAKKLQTCQTRCEQQISPAHIGTRQPAFSWQLKSSTRNTMQSAYQIIVAESRDALRKRNNLLWDSGKRQSQASLQIPYEGKALQPFHTYFWQIKVWDNHNNESAWSEIQQFQTGPLTESDWYPARWITMDTISAQHLIYPGYQAPSAETDPQEFKEPRMPQFRKEFHIGKKVRSARIYISGLGHFELSINGTKASDHFLDPAWSRYDREAFYVTYDITRLLHAGENVITARLGNGFLHIPRINERYHKLLCTFSAPKMIAKIRIDYTDGSTSELYSDKSWKVSPSPVTFSSIYGGEDYDATREPEGWEKAGFNDSTWENAKETPSTGKLMPQQSNSMKIMRQFDAVRIYKPKSGIFIYDFGQNASAIIRLKAKGKRGAKITFRPAEYLTPDSLPDQRNSGQPYSFSYTLAENGTETWTPSFSYYGFRYVAVEGAVPAGYENPDDLPVIEELNMLHVSNSNEAIGTFSCSDSLFNAIYSLIDWSVKSNMSHVLTDCPHREKLGWLEVTHLMSHALSYCYDTHQFFHKIIDDMDESQLPNGLIPSIAPEYTAFDGDFRDSPEWGSAGILLPWFLYEWYGDSSAIKEHFGMMTAYIDYLTSRAQHNILYHGLGDWYDQGPAHPGYSQLTSRGLTPTAFYYRDLCIMAQSAQLLGKDSLRQLYEQRAQEVKEAFNEKFFNTAEKYYDRGSQTANAIALCMGLVDKKNRESCLRQIIADIRQHGNSMTSGDIGFNYLVMALLENGYSQVIYEMNCQSDKPGYGYQLKQGATSLTESWAALKTASHNHCMLGHLMGWFYQGLGGIRPISGEIAFKHFLLNPEPVGNIQYASATFRSPYGLIESRWEIKGPQFIYHITVPSNTRATVCLPTDTPDGIKEGKKPVEQHPEIHYSGIVNGRCTYEIGSGEYEFSLPWPGQKNH